MILSKEKTQERSSLYHNLMQSAKEKDNTHWVARILSSWLLGIGVMPDGLGLSEEQFRLLASRYSGMDIPFQAPSGNRISLKRLDEIDDLRNFLLPFCSVPSPEKEWTTEILVVGCLGNDHLWSDMGFWSRSDLSGMITYNFPEMALRNNKDMKWKKFLYKQLCTAEGIYVCRSPSCEICVDYPFCFGPEE